MISFRDMLLVAAAVSLAVFFALVANSIWG